MLPSGGDKTWEAFSDAAAADGEESEESDDGDGDTEDSEEHEEATNHNGLLRIGGLAEYHV